LSTFVLSSSSISWILTCQAVICQVSADFVIKDSDVLIVMGDEKMLEKVVAS
jgi:uncharacterized protein with PhoU and TrkA domain